MAVDELTFVASPRANVFMREILEALASAVASLGVSASVVDRFPAARDGLVHVVIPHELFDFDVDVTGEQLARTVALCTEQPGTGWFDRGLAHAARCGAVADVSVVGAAEAVRRGVPSAHVQLGYVPEWDRWDGGAGVAKDVDVTFLGTLNRERDVLLSGYGETLWRWRSELIVTGIAPKTGPGPDFFVGDAKRDRLARARVQVSPGRQPAPYFEWVRALEAMSNGCVFVCDHAVGDAPLVPGEHYLSGAPENLALLADGLLRAPERLAAIRDAAYAFVRDELPMTLGAERLLELAAPLAATVARPDLPPPPPPPAVGVVEGVPDPATAVMKKFALETIALRRRVAELEAAARGERADAGPRVVRRTPAWDGAAPRVTVCIPCFEHGDVAVEALASVAAQTFGPLEVLVLDDASTDDSVAVLTEALAARPWLPATLLAAPVNRGLPAARNAMVARARGELVLMLDADNELHPPALERLVAALDDDPDALFAYPTLAGHADGSPTGLLSYRAWDPRLLRERNIVDALALLRRERLVALGGYTEDLRMYGWEDYDLWARAAEAGEHGVHVPEILARYRQDPGSMRSITDIDTGVMYGLLQQRYPRTMGPL